MIIDLCADLVKTRDYGRYITVFFAPRRLRNFLWVLYALNCELAHIRHMVARENMMGLIRLQWWRDAIAELYDGQILNHHVLHGLATLKDQKEFWQRDDFNHLIDLYEEDFRHDKADKDAMLGRHVQQNKVLLEMALKLYDRAVAPEIINMVALRHTQAKYILQNEWLPNHLPIFTAHAEHDLQSVPRHAIRGLAPLLLVDIARYDFSLIRKAGYKQPDIIPETYRSLMAFYLWRKNILFNIKYL